MAQASDYWVLVVEDDPSFATLIEKILIQTGVNLQHCSSAVEALDYLETHEPDLMILDIGMAEMNGWRLLELIKGVDVFKDVPIVISTAFGDPANKLVGKMQEVDYYLTKPFAPDELRRIVAKLLNL